MYVCVVKLDVLLYTIYCVYCINVIHVYSILFQTTVLLRLSYFKLIKADHFKVSINFLEFKTRLR